MPSPFDPAHLAKHFGLARRRAELFSLPLRDHHWRGSVGNLTGMGAGSSLDFHDHRHYYSGDDPRHINWQAYARTGQYTLKLYREEARPIVDIILDVSSSMFTPDAKAERVLELFYFAAASSEKHGASLNLHLVRGPHNYALPRETLFAHRWGELVESLPETTASAAPALKQSPLRPGSLRVWITDLLYLAAPESLLQALTRERGRAVLLCPYTREESAPNWSGAYEFIESESHSRHDRRVDRHLLNRYLEAYQRHFDSWKSAALRAKVPLGRVAGEGSFEKALRPEAIPTHALILG
jgi:uncharacterized protein (DUF58 family)